MVIFIFRQLALQKRNGALLDLRTFTSRNFTVCVILMALLMGALFGVIIVLPHLSAERAGVAHAEDRPAAAARWTAHGPACAANRASLRPRGSRPLVIPGIFIVTVVLWSMTLLTPHTPPAYILAGHVVMSVGFALLFTPLFTTSLSSVNPQLYSHGSATLASIQAGRRRVGRRAADRTDVVAQCAVLLATGIPPIDALTGGIRAAFFAAAIFSLVAVVCVFFVQRPRMPGADAPPAHG